MKLIYIIVLHILALSTGTHASERQLRAKASRRSNRPSTSPTSTPTASQSTRRRPKASKRTRRPIASQSSTPTRNPSTYPSTSPSESPSNSPFAYHRNETAKLTASDGAAGDRFGYRVSISGNVAIVGAYEDDDNGNGSGSAYIYEMNESAGHWDEVAKLTAADGTAGDDFGRGVSISGNTAIIGANYDDDNGNGSGSAYVFEKNESTGHWNETAKLTASDGAEGDKFGRSVSVSGNIAIVGAYEDDDKDSDSGSAYLFEKDETTGQWIETAKLTASDGAANDEFGRSVSVSGNVVIVGALYDNDKGSDSGSAYVFEKDQSTGHWNQTAKLTASDGAAYDEFGHSVSVSGHIVVVGAYYDDKNNGIGSAYVYEKDASTGYWSETAKLTASDGAPDDLFGVSVSISDNIVIVGAYYDDDNDRNSGSAYLFERDDSTGQWGEVAKLTASDGEADDYFGRSVSISGKAAVVGAYLEDSNGSSSGSAYVFDI